MCSILLHSRIEEMNLCKVYVSLSPSFEDSQFWQKRSSIGNEKPETPYEPIWLKHNQTWFLWFSGISDTGPSNLSCNFEDKRNGASTCRIPLATWNCRHHFWAVSHWHYMNIIWHISCLPLQYMWNIVKPYDFKQKQKRSQRKGSELHSKTSTEIYCWLFQNTRASACQCYQCWQATCERLMSCRLQGTISSFGWSTCSSTLCCLRCA